MPRFVTQLIGLSTFIVGLAGCAGSVHHINPLAHQIDALIDQAVQPNTEAESLRKLEALGPDAIPNLVGHLGDMRSLPMPDIELSSRGGGKFEGIVHYKPVVVHDAVAAILNQLTGQSFVFVYNGASPEERQSNRAMWREWCERNYPAKSATCGY